VLPQVKHSAASSSLAARQEGHSMARSGRIIGRRDVRAVALR
jgi:hypothetical protein